MSQIVTSNTVFITRAKSTPADTFNTLRIKQLPSDSPYLCFIGSTPLAAEFYLSPYNSTRRAKLLLFSYCLSQYDEFRRMPFIEKTKHLKSLERSCYNYTIDKAYNDNIPTSWDVNNFCDLYHSTCYKISSNLEKKGIVDNPNFAKLLLSGNLSIEQLPKLSSIEMYPTKYIEILQRIMISKSASQTIKTSAMYKCRRCKENQCMIENRYNRSLDEAINLTITCMNCGYEWNG